MDLSAGLIVYSTELSTVSVTRSRRRRLMSDSYRFAPYALSLCGSTLPRRDSMNHRAADNNGTGIRPAAPSRLLAANMKTLSVQSSIEPGRPRLRFLGCVALLNGVLVTCWAIMQTSEFAASSPYPAPSLTSMTIILSLEALCLALYALIRSKACHSLRTRSARSQELPARRVQLRLGLRAFV
jgi:hypothetical protein